MGPVEAHQLNTVTVSGVGEVRVAPEIAELDVSLEVMSSSPGGAFGEVATISRLVLEAVDAQGLAETDRQTRSVSLRAHHDPQTAAIVGYVATYGLRLRLVRLSAAGELLDAVVSVAGDALRLGGFTLRSPQAVDAAERAEVAAVADARRRAQRLAEAGGASLGPVLAIEESPFPGGGSRRAAGLGGQQSFGVPVESGSETVTAGVTVTFRLDPARTDMASAEPRPASATSANPTSSESRSTARPS